MYGPLSPEHHHIPHETKTPFAWAAMLATTVYGEGRRVCTICQASELEVGGECKRMLHHYVDEHAKELKHVRTMQELLKTIQEFREKNTRYTPACPIRECVLECKNDLELYIHLTLMHNHESKLDLLVCPFCTTPVGRGGIEGCLNQVAHTFTCCMRDVVDVGAIIVHKLAKHPRAFFRNMSEDTRVLFARNLYNSKERLPWPVRAPIMTVKSMNKRIGDILELDFTRAVTCRNMDQVMKMMEEFNELESTLKVLTEKYRPDESDWKRANHESIEAEFMKQLRSHTDRAKVIEGRGVLLETVPMRIRGVCRTCEDTMDHSSSEDKCIIRRQRMTMERVLLGLGRNSLLPDVQGVLIAAKKDGNFDTLPMTTKYWANLSCSESGVSFPGSIEENQEITVTGEGKIEINKRSYFDSVRAILRKGNWPKNVPIVLEFFITPSEARTSGDIYLRASAFAQQLDKLRERFEGTYFVLLPLPPWKRYKSKEGDTVLRETALYREIAAISTLIFMSIKVIPVPTLSILESEPIRCQDNILSAWHEAAFRIPARDPYTRNKFGSPTREFWRRYGMLLDCISEAMEQGDRTMETWRDILRQDKHLELKRPSRSFQDEMPWNKTPRLE